ncbi:MAG: hypothetical protein H0U27_06195 [Nitrosopumilus sp.]|nr:hypothetical protein [Nitrosopumilus sp.]
MFVSLQIRVIESLIHSEIYGTKPVKTHTFFDKIFTGISDTYRSAKINHRVEVRKQFNEQQKLVDIYMRDYMGDTKSPILAAHRAMADIANKDKVKVLIRETDSYFDRAAANHSRILRNANHHLGDIIKNPVRIRETDKELDLSELAKYQDPVAIAHKEMVNRANKEFGWIVSTKK